MEFFSSPALFLASLRAHVQVGNQACQLAASTLGKSVLLPLVGEGSVRCPGPGDEPAGCGASHTHWHPLRPLWPPGLLPVA